MIDEKSSERKTVQSNLQVTKRFGLYFYFYFAFLCVRFFLFVFIYSFIICSFSFSCCVFIPSLNGNLRGLYLQNQQITKKVTNRNSLLNNGINKSKIRLQNSNTVLERWVWVHKTKMNRQKPIFEYLMATGNIHSHSRSQKQVRWQLNPSYSQLQFSISFFV